MAEFQEGMLSQADSIPDTPVLFRLKTGPSQEKGTGCTENGPNCIDPGVPVVSGHVLHNI